MSRVEFCFLSIVPIFSLLLCFRLDETNQSDSFAFMMLSNPPRAESHKSLLEIDSRHVKGQLEKFKGELLSFAKRCALELPAGYLREPPKTADDPNLSAVIHFVL